jgi:hypothetical protein
VLAAVSLSWLHSKKKVLKSKKALSWHNMQSKSTGEKQSKTISMRELLLICYTVLHSKSKCWSATVVNTTTVPFSFAQSYMNWNWQEVRSNGVVMCSQLGWSKILVNRCETQDSHLFSHFKILKA